jgi:hypothetical protein
MSVPASGGDLGAEDTDGVGPPFELHLIRPGDDLFALQVIVEDAKLSGEVVAVHVDVDCLG